MKKLSKEEKEYLELMRDPVIYVTKEGLQDGKDYDRN